MESKLLQTKDIGDFSSVAACHFGSCTPAAALARILHEGGGQRRCKSRRSIDCMVFSFKDWGCGLSLFGFRTNLALHFERSRF